MNNLSINVFKKSSINNKGLPIFLKKHVSKKNLSSSWVKPCPIRTNLEATISQIINHTKFVFCWQRTQNGCTHH